MAQVIKKGVLKAILKLILSLLLLFFLLVGAVQFPFVQTKLVSHLSKELSEITGFDISLERIDINWLDRIDVTGLKVVDPEGNRLFYTQNAVIDFDVRAILDKDNRNIDEIIVKNAALYFTKIPLTDSTETLNINALIRRLRRSIRKQSTSRKLFSIDEVKLENASFTYYQNDSSKSMRSGLDYKHFSVENIYGDFENLLSMSDTLEVKVQNLSAKEYLSGLTLRSLKTDFHLSQKSMRFEGLSLEVGDSYITDTVIFNYNSTKDLSDFVDMVTIDAHLKNTTINSRDLALFAPQMKAYKDKYKINGEFNGKVKAFILNDATVKLGNNTQLKGKIRMTGLPDFQETFIDFDLNNSQVRVSDLRQYINSKTYTRLSPFTDIRLSASFLGFPNDFVTKGSFFTNHGRIESDINLKIRPDVNESIYSGKLKLDKFDLQGYTGDDFFGLVSLNGEIEGSGFTVEKADFKLNGNIQKIDLYGYKYKNIKTDARISKEFFEGFLEVNDPNLKLTTTGSIDLRAGINFFNVNAQIDTMNFQPLNLSDKPLFISSNIQINASGLEIDNVVGQANFYDSFIKYQGESLSLDSLNVVSLKNIDSRKLAVSTNLVDFNVAGSFSYTTLYKDFKTLIKEYRLNIQNDKDSLDAYYRNKTYTGQQDYSLDYELSLKNANPLFELFVPELYIAEDTKIDGSFTGGYTSILSVNTESDTVKFKSDDFYENELQINISKVADSTNVLAMIYLGSNFQQIAGIETKDLFFEGIWNKNHIDFEFDIDQVKFENYAKLIGEVDFLAYETVLHLDPSDLQILDKKWTIDENNLIVIRKDETSISDLRIYSENQNISINGQLSRDPEKELDILIENLRLKNFNTIINQKLAGTVNGNATIKDYYNNLFIESAISVDQFKIDQFLVGDVSGSNIWNNTEQSFNTNFFVNRLGKRILDINGSYQPDDANALDLTARLNDTELKILEPFFDSFFTEMKGTADGTLTIQGALSKPIITGDGLIKDAGLHVNYLNTDYKLAGKFNFKESSIGFEDIDITDSRGEKATLSGNFSHNYFKDFFINIGGDFEDFMLLNTTSKDNKLFYGTGIGTGEIDFVGPIRNMNIIARAKTEKDTRIYIPIGDNESIQQEEYINFVNFNDSTVVDPEEAIEKVDLRGLKLDFDLDITPDAYTEIIFDIKSGDIIRGRGKGDLKLQIDTKGEFNMFGDFSIQEGGYNFTLYNIINKEFEILPDSKISWYGDPYEGILNINATYNQLASFLPLLVQQENDTIYQESTELRRKYPVKVLLDIDGPLLSPTVSFDIVAENLPRNVLLSNGEVKDLEFEFLAFKNRIDEQELKRQVFSLIVLRKFSPLQSFNTGGSITSSVSELFSNQLSYWITQVDENLEIDVDLGQLDQEAFNTFQLRLSYTFLDGRLRVTRDGGFTNQENKADISSIAGDWTLEYLLTPDGKFKVKMYNRTNYNPINPNEDNQNTITTGFSLIHTQSFDKIKDLFKESRDKARQKVNDEPAGEENEESRDSTINNEAIKNEEDESDG
ncbi:translocation/assembly module TamB [Fulvivirga sp. RKSG066]|uniref:translocation/assembly module TamB domain-containing protein n=1 Tax=Fulvivirga aurantia TaxID=2529383 RepID=UPI0012BD0011|nr:translocation/assembly module TamB domain-containing protein [Fulvivirga aurantia]MTI22388.1 translocation/assembly module TamB [Fulvivirga aurantia]